MAIAVALCARPGAAASLPEPLPEALASMRGRPIAAVELSAPPGESAHELLELIDIQPGHLLGRAAVEAAIERIFALGRFAQIDARVLPLEEAVILRLTLTPVVHLERLVVSGIAHSSAESLMRTLALGTGDVIDGGSEARLVARARAHLSKVGYPLAEIHVERSAGEAPNTCRLKVHINEGPPVTVFSVTLRGPMRAPHATLKSLVYTRPGAVLDSEKLESDRQRLLTELHERGFLRARVGRAQIRHAPEGAHVSFEVEARERLSFHIVGAHALTPKQIVALWPNDQATEPHKSLGIFRRRLQAALATLSYPDAQIALKLAPTLAVVSTPQERPDLHRPEASHRVAPHPLDRAVYVRIHEGPAIWVERLVLAGTPVLPQPLIAEQISALLARDLSNTNFFTPLGPGVWPRSEGPSQPLRRTPHQVPPKHRWVPELYEQVAEDITLALRELGYTEAQVMPPSLRRHDHPLSASQSAGLLDALAEDDSGLGVPSGRVKPGGPAPLVGGTAVLNIEPGQQHFLGDITFVGNHALSAARLLEVVREATGEHALRAPIVPGAPLSWQGIEDGRIAIVRALRDAGHHYARATAELNDEGEAFAELTYHIEEGPPVSLAHVLIRGNRFTRAGIIRSRMTLSPGRRYRLSEAVGDQRDIMALGTFNSVRVRLTDEEHPAEEKDVVVEVEERARQPIEVVPGLSTAAGPRLRLAYSHINVMGTASVFVASLKLNRQVFFDLYGPYAENMRERYAAYHGHEQLTRAIEREVRLGLRSPPIKHLPFDPLVRLDLVDQRINAVRYSLDAATAILGVDMVPSRRLKLSVEIQAGITNLECPLGDACNQTLEVRRLRGGYPIQEGWRNTLKVGPRLVYEGRNSPVSPNRGLFLMGRVTQAVGAAKPEDVTTPFAFLKWEAQAITYAPVFGATLALSARTGSINIQRDQVPVDERFFLGGRDTLRGFVETTLIPEDACVVADPAGPLPRHCLEGIPNSPSPPLSLGGNTFVLFKGELRLPLRDQFSFDIFADVGNLWIGLFDSDRFNLRVGTGVGLRYATPVGALTIDFGVNPHPRRINEEARWQLHFSIGSF